jgi:hypothetical protein
MGAGRALEIEVVTFKSVRNDEHPTIGRSGESHADYSSSDGAIGAGIFTEDRSLVCS